MDLGLQRKTRRPDYETHSLAQHRGRSPREEGAGRAVVGGTLGGPGVRFALGRASLGGTSTTTSTTTTTTTTTATSDASTITTGGTGLKPVLRTNAHTSIAGRHYNNDKSNNNSNYNSHHRYYYHRSYGDGSSNGGSGVADLPPPPSTSLHRRDHHHNHHQEKQQQPQQQHQQQQHHDQWARAPQRQKYKHYHHLDHHQHHHHQPTAMELSSATIDDGAGTGGPGAEFATTTTSIDSYHFQQQQQQQQQHSDSVAGGGDHNNNSSTNHHHPHHLMQPADGVSTSSCGESTKYWSYPPTKPPFVNSEIPSSTTASSLPSSGSGERAVNTYPTSDRDAVISALRNLQDKVKNLELERTEAERNLHSLATETEQYKEMLNHDKTSGKGKQMTFGSYMENGDGYAALQAKELEGQLTSAENRCRLLEQQLENMRTMVHTSERSRRELVERTARARHDKEQAVLASAAAASSAGGGAGAGGGGRTTAAAAAADLAGHMDRLNELERDQMRLTATQTLAESKIRELEERVKEERIHRRLLQERTDHLELEKKRNKTPAPPQPRPATAPHPRPTSAPHPHAPRIPVTTQTPHVQKKSKGTSSSTSPQMVKSKKLPKKKMKKKAVPARRPASAHCARESEQSRHYRLNLAEIPFVAGRSTSASHSLGANVQKVLAMLKTHNKALCSSHPWTTTNSYPNHQDHAGHRSGSPYSSSSSAGDATDVSSGIHDLGELLGQLQDEFGQLCSEQQEVMTALHEAHGNGDFRLQTDLEGQLDTLVSRMEAKSGQIAKIRQYQQKRENGKKSRPAPTKSIMKSKRPHSAGRLPTTTTTTTSSTTTVNSSPPTNGYSHHHYSHNYYQSRNINGNSRPKPPQYQCNKAIGHSALGKPALFMLRDMKKLQSTLRKDDLCWE